MNGRHRGVNVDPAHVGPNGEPINAPPPGRLQEHGINAVRLVSRDVPIVRQYAQQCQESGIFVLGVVASESNGFVMDEANAIQIGNEPDGVHEEGKPAASWIMSEVDYVTMWNDFRNRFHDRHLITAGLNRANSSWNWHAVAPQLDRPDGIARHSYFPRTPPSALMFALNDMTAPLPGVPLWITEWHPDPVNIDRGETADLATVMDGATVADFFYCWSDHQTAGRGLYLDDGQTPKEVLRQYARRPGMPSIPGVS